MLLTALNKWTEKNKKKERWTVTHWLWTDAAGNPCVDTAFLSSGGTTLIFFPGGPKLNFRQYQRKKEGFTLDLQNLRWGPVPWSPLLYPRMNFTRLKEVI